MKNNTTVFQLRFRSLYLQGRGFAFPCDAQGMVDVERLSVRGRESYVHARELVGREFAVPEVRAVRLRAAGVLPVLARVKREEVDA